MIRELSFSLAMTLLRTNNFPLACKPQNLHVDMPVHTLISAIASSRKQASRRYRKLAALKMRTLFAALVLFSMLIAPLTLCAKGAADVVLAQPAIDSYIVKEMGKPAPLMSKDVERSISPASLTKILTCIIAIESGKLEQEVLITKESTMVEPSKAGFREGEKIKLIDLVRAAMVSSSNDAAFAIAIHLSGSVDSFVATMNRKAKVIGMTNSLFTNPAGFDKGIYAGNSSTAADLMRLTEYSVKNPLFNQVARLEKVVIAEQTSGKLYSLKTHNKLLDRYPYAIGIKTGYTCKAGGCLIARAVKDNKDLLLVMLNARNRWDIASTMFDSAFASNGGKAISFSGIARSNVVPSRTLSLSKKAEKRRAITVAKSGHKSKKLALAEVKNGKPSKKQAIAKLKNSSKLKKQVLADAKSRNKMKKRQLLSSKSSKKSQKES